MEDGVQHLRDAARALWAALVAQGKAGAKPGLDGLDAWLQWRVRPHKTGIDLLDHDGLVKTLRLLLQWEETGKCPPKGGAA